MTPEAYEKLKGNVFETYKDVNLKVFKKQGDGLCKCHCDICDKDYEISLMTLRERRHAGYNPCVFCNPIGSILVKHVSDRETELYNYIASKYNGQIIKSDRTILDGKELDIYLPGLNLAFEFDGLYWHNEITKSSDYHVSKTNVYESKGIQLIHIFEDDWLYKSDIVKSRINGLLGLNNRIFARKCIIKEISNNDAATFLNENHIQGSCVSKYRYGLYFNDELISIMTFGKSRFSDEFELLRFCNKLNINVVGGASRLFNHFLNNHDEIVEVISYADRCWSKGNLYDKLGFIKDGITKPAYYYIIDNKRQNRIKFQKHKLVKEGFNPSKTEHEIMLE